MKNTNHYLSLLFLSLFCLNLKAPNEPYSADSNGQAKFNLDGVTAVQTPTADPTEIHQTCLKRVHLFTPFSTDELTEAKKRALDGLNTCINEGTLNKGHVQRIAAGETEAENILRACLDHLESNFEHISIKAKNVEHSLKGIVTEVKSNLGNFTRKHLEALTLLLSWLHDSDQYSADKTYSSELHLQRFALISIMERLGVYPKWPYVVAGIFSFALVGVAIVLTVLAIKKSNESSSNSSNEVTFGCQEVAPISTALTFLPLSLNQISVGTLNAAFTAAGANVMYLAVALAGQTGVIVPIAKDDGKIIKVTQGAESVLNAVAKALNSSTTTSQVQSATVVAIANCKN